MIDKVLSILAPHPCFGCGEMGAALCDNCKYNIVQDQARACFGCSKLVGDRGVCGACSLPYSRAWCVGLRRDELAKLIDGYKFSRTKSLAGTLADLLMERLPALPPEVVVVPIPTAASHIRQRGYDHTLLIAKRVAKARGLALEQVLVRQSSTKQRGASRRVRETQARQAFGAKPTVSSGKAYLLIDDVVTTGATLKHAAKVLREAGATEVWVAALVQNPLD